MLIPPNTMISPPGSTTVPAGTVTAITGFTGVPTTNIGGITVNNGFFTIPCSGRYIITANVCFATPATTPPAGDFREVTIYRVSGATNVITLLAVDSRPPIAGSPTCVDVTTIADLQAGDRIFIGARQNSGVTIQAEANTGRLAITRVC